MTSLTQENLSYQLPHQFLIIPCNAAGMGSILRSAISGFIFAAYTQRIPVIYWHQNCNYLKSTALPYHNAFLDYFESTCPFNIEAAFKQSSTTYPTGTRIENLNALLDDQQRTLSRNEEYFNEICTSLASEAELIVFPTHVSLQKVLRAIPSDHRFHEMEEQALVHWAAGKYLKVKKEISEQVDRFWSVHFTSSEKIVTVHIRVGDKYRESILPSFARYKNQVDIFLKQHSKGMIYLATDSSHAVDYFKKCYKDKVVTSPAVRSSGRKGVHKTGAEGIQIGNEILFDVECLSRGIHFIGFDESNIFFWVRHLTKAGINDSFTSVSVRAGVREVLLNRQSLKRTLKIAWKRLRASSKR